MVDQIVAPNEEVDLSAEEQHNQEMIAKVDGNEVPTERPEMDNSGDQFQGDYNKLKQSYDALRSKMDSGNAPEVTADLQEELGIPQDPEVAEGALDMTALTEEYMSQGGLSDKSYKDLESKGISRDMANQYIAGQKALGEQIGNQVKNSVGGQEEYQNMVEWAKSNYTQDQIQAYDDAVNSGNTELAKMAARGLQADYQNKAGVEGETYSGTQAAPEGVGDVFRSNAEVTAMMKDPRYEYDHAFRQDVLNKLDRSDIFSQGKL